jgi:hypothetical protein
MNLLLACMVRWEFKLWSPSTRGYSVPRANQQFILKEPYLLPPTEMIKWRQMHLSSEAFVNAVQSVFLKNLIFFFVKI